MPEKIEAYRCEKCRTLLATNECYLLVDITVKKDGAQTAIHKTDAAFCGVVCLTDFIQREITGY